MRWPRCYFKFFIRDDRQHWRICAKPWGHWIRRGEPGRHAGPVVGVRSDAK